MHVAIALLVILAVWFRGDWRHWRKFHETILFVALANLLYNFLTYDHFLWRHTPQYLPSHIHAELLCTFIIFPGTVILFLGNYPEETKQKIIHFVKWVLIYFFWEVFFLLTGRIEYQNGWNLWCSFAFLIAMFALIRFHHKRPLLSYVISGIVAVVILWLFEIPIHHAMEEKMKRVTIGLL